MSNPGLEPVPAPAPVVQIPVTPNPTNLPAPEIVAQTPPVVETPTPTPVPIEAPIPAPVAEVKPEPTILGVEPKEIPEAPVVAETKTEGGQSDEPAPPPKYDPFTLPDDVKLDSERVTKFTDLLSDLEIKGKADHALVQEFGQKAVEFHINEVKKATEDLANLYKTEWDNIRTGWKDQFLKDPEIGGNKFQTTVDAANAFIRTHGGTAERQAEFRELMETSGLGNHPAMLRILAQAGRAMSEGTPLAAKAPPPSPKSKTQVMYGKG